ncbi:MAG: hypothetical protein HS113_07770 [Verrucomicrobiales bacterium]|nr:hypothetical protein [Verrucomicrobiales bacterium]
MNLTKHGGFLAAVLLALLSGAVVAQAPVRTEVIPTLGRMGALAIQPDGLVLAGGFAFLSRLYPDGTREDLPSRHILNTSKLGVQADGGILIQDHSRLWRLGPDGLDPTRIDTSRDFALQPDGNLLVSSFSGLVRRTPDGSLDPSFASTIPTSLETSVELQEDGKILVGSAIPPLVQRLDPDGTPDASFQSELQPTVVTGIVPQPDGKVLLSGHLVMGGEISGLIRLNADGSVDPGFRPPPELVPPVGGLALQADGKLVVVGSFQATDAAERLQLFRLAPDGTLETLFAVEPLEQVSRPVPPYDRVRLAIEEDGAILVGASSNVIRVVHSEPATQRLAIEGTTIQWLRDGASAEIFHAQFASSTDGVVWTNLGSGRRIPGGWSLEGVRVADGARVRARGFVSGTSWYLETISGPPLLKAGPASRTNDVGSAVVFRVAAKGDEPLSFRWFKDGVALPEPETASLRLPHVTWLDSGEYSVQVSNALGSLTSPAARLTVRDPVLLTQPRSQWVNAGSDGQLEVGALGTALGYQWRKDGLPIAGATNAVLRLPHVGGSDSGDYDVVLTGAGGTVASSVASLRVNLALPDAWNPRFAATTEWYPFQSAAFQANGALLMGGLFRTLDWPTRANLVRFHADGTLDASFAPVIEGPDPLSVNAIAIEADDRIVIGGSFTKVAGQERTYLARLEADGTLDADFVPLIAGQRGTGPSQVMALQFLPDGRLLVGGSFSSVDGYARPGLARLTREGRLDSSFDPQAGHVPTSIWSLVRQPDGKLLVAGWGLTRLNPDGTADPTFQPEVSASSVSRLLLQPDGKILISGSGPGFLNASVRLNPDGTVDRSFSDPYLEGVVQALQADGKILLERRLGGVETDGRPGPALTRLNTNGIEELSLGVAFDNHFGVLGIAADGTIPVAGTFTTVAGQSRPQSARLRSAEAVTDTLSLFGRTATWLRSGPTIEIERCTFAYSTDGIHWQEWGAGRRIQGGWVLEDLELNSAGVLRVRGFAGGSVYERRLEVPLWLQVKEMRHDAGAGQAILAGIAPPGKRVALESSGDLKHWETVAIEPAGGEPLRYSVPRNSGVEGVFFRLRQLTD